MLETPKAEAADYATMLSDCTPNVLMDNQQATLELGWAVAAIEGEGCICITKGSDHRMTGPKLNASVIVENTNPSFIERLARALKLHGIPHFVQDLSLAQLTRWAQVNETKQRMPKQSRKRLTVTGLHRVKKLVETLGPHFEAKRDQITLIGRFCDSRLENLDKPYSDYEWSLYRQLQQAKRPRESSLTNEQPTAFLQ